MATINFEYDLGDKVQDKITGYEGIVTGCTRWLHGCNRYAIQAHGLKDGKPIDPISVDEDALTLIERAVVQATLQRREGGPGDMPSRGPDASR